MIDWISLSRVNIQGILHDLCHGPAERLTCTSSAVRRWPIPPPSATPSTSSAATAQEPTVVVVSAMAGTTDALLGVAQQAGAGESRTVASLIARLRSRHAEVARALLPAGRGRADVLAVHRRRVRGARGAGAGPAPAARAHPAHHRLPRLARRAAERAPRRRRARGRRAPRQSTSMPSTSSTPTAPSARPRPTSRAPTAASSARSLPLLARGIVPVVPGFIGATPEGEVATLGRGGSDLTATLLARALGAARVSLWKDVPGPPHRRSARGARRARHPAAPRPRGGGAGLLRRQGAAPARADPGRRAAHPGLRPPVRRPRRRPAPRSPSGWRPARVPGQGAHRRRRARRWSRSPATACSACPGIAARTFARAARAADLGLAHLAGLVGALDLLQRARAARGRRAREPRRASSAARSRGGEIDGVEVEPGMATVAVVGLGMHGTPGHRRRRVLRARGRRRSTSWPSRRARSELNISVVVEAPAGRRGAAADPRARSSSRASPAAAVIQPERMEVVLLGFGQIGRSAGRADRARCAGRRSSLKVAGGHRPLGLRVRSRRD